METKPIEVHYDEPNLNEGKSTDVNLETILGNIPRVTATPTWTPKLFKDNFAISLITGTYKFHVYDPVANVWKSVTLS